MAKSKFVDLSVPNHPLFIRLSKIINIHKTSKADKEEFGGEYVTVICQRNRETMCMLDAHAVMEKIRDAENSA